jgi:hypothetical protein
MQPIFIPSRSLKVAMDFFARVTTGRWPVMLPRSSKACSSSLGWRIASPSPMFRTIFSTSGTSKALV